MLRKRRCSIKKYGTTAVVVQKLFFSLYILHIVLCGIGFYIRALHVDMRFPRSFIEEGITLLSQLVNPVYKFNHVCDLAISPPLSIHLIFKIILNM